MANSDGNNMSSWTRKATLSDAVERVARDKRDIRCAKADSDMAPNCVPAKLTNLSSDAGCGDVTIVDIMLRRWRGV